MKKRAASAKYSPPLPRGTYRRMPAPFHRSLPGLRHCIDLACPEGTPVRAARGGVVVMRKTLFATTYRDRHYAHKANFVVIRHTDGDKSMYAHLMHLSVRVHVSDVVRRGQVIALSGQTGYAGYPHLHFGVYRNGKNVPVKFNK